MNFSRLEYREILRCIQDTDCDPDVLAKVRAAIQGVVAPASAAPILPRNAPEEARPAAVVGGTMTPPDDSWKLQYDATWMSQINPRTNKPWFTPEDVDVVNQERAINIAAAGRMREGIPYTLRAPPAIPAGHGIVHTEIGKKNRVGDVCVGLRVPATGEVIRDINAFLASDIPLADTLSIFECKNGDTHGYYADENPSRAGCPKCFYAGGGDVEQQVEEERPAIKIGTRGSYQDEEGF